MGRSEHNHAVWSTPVPPVSTYQWDSRDWTTYEDLNRPANYRGGRYDKEAWDAYQRTQELMKVQSFYRGFGLVPPGVLWG